MDYAEALLKLTQSVKLYRQAVLKHQIETAEQFAKTISEMSTELVAATARMGEKYGKYSGRQVS